MQVHITRFNSKPATRKDGSEVTTKSGKPMFKVGIQTAEYGDKWINGLVPFNPDRWEGTEQELIIKDDPQWGLQFELPPRENKAPITAAPQGLGEIKLSITNLHRKMDSVINHLSGDNRLDRTSDGSPMPNFDVKRTEEEYFHEHA